MEPGEALGIAAQIAVALAGFAGVVVVFRRESVHEWSAVDKLRLRLLLANSILPLGLCMLGLLLLTIKPMPPGIWRWCSGVAFMVSLFFVITTTKIFRRLDLATGKRERVTVHFLSIRSVRLAPYFLQLYNTVLLGRVLAILHWHRFSTDHRRVPVCAHDPSAARIEPATSGAGESLLRRFGVVKTTVINGEPTAAMLGVDFDKAVAELNIAPACNPFAFEPTLRGPDRFQPLILKTAHGWLRETQQSHQKADSCRRLYAADSAPRGKPSADRNGV